MHKDEATMEKKILEEKLQAETDKFQQQILILQQSKERITQQKAEEIDELKKQIKIIEGKKEFVLIQEQHNQELEKLDKKYRISLDEIDSKIAEIEKTKFTLKENYKKYDEKIEPAQQKLLKMYEELQSWKKQSSQAVYTKELNDLASKITKGQAVYKQNEEIVTKEIEKLQKEKQKISEELFSLNQEYDNLLNKKNDILRQYGTSKKKIENTNQTFIQDQDDSIKNFYEEEFTKLQKIKERLEKSKEKKINEIEKVKALNEQKIEDLKGKYEENYSKIQDENEGLKKRKKELKETIKQMKLEKENKGPESSQSKENLILSKQRHIKEVEELKKQNAALKLSKETLKANEKKLKEKYQKIKQKKNEEDDEHEILQEEETENAEKLKQLILSKQRYIERVQQLEQQDEQNKQLVENLKRSKEDRIRKQEEERTTLQEKIVHLERQIPPEDKKTKIKKLEQLMKELKKNHESKKAEHDKITRSIQETEDLQSTRGLTSASLQKLTELKQTSKEIILQLERYSRAIEDAQKNIEALNRESDEDEIQEIFDGLYEFQTNEALERLKEEHAREIRELKDKISTGTLTTQHQII
jgi:hypothetical protein